MRAPVADGTSSPAATIKPQMLRGQCSCHNRPSQSSAQVAMERPLKGMQENSPK